MRKLFVMVSAILLITTLLLSVFLSPHWYPFFVIVLLLTGMGYYDMIQTRHSIMRIYPVFGRLLYFM